MSKEIEMSDVLALLGSMMGIAAMLVGVLGWFVVLPTVGLLYMIGYLT